MRSLHLLVPGLFWLDAADPRPYGAITLPGIETLLTRGRLRAEPAAGFEGWIGSRYGYAAGQTPMAALAAEEAGTGAWLNADPVHLSPRGAELFLTAGDALSIRPEEAAALVATLNEFFEEDGLRFHVLRPDRWIVRAPGPAASLRTVSLSAAHGRAIEPLLPDGADARPWLKRLNEAQMLLHAHAVNEQRDAAGLPGINSLWFSGPGVRQAPREKPFDSVTSPEAWVTAVARLSGAERTSTRMPEQGAVLADATRGRALLHVPRCWEAAASADEPAWRDALSRLESEYVQPALMALRTGMTDAVSITGFGGREGVSTTLGRLELLRFWRRRRGLAPVSRMRVS